MNTIGYVDEERLEFIPPKLRITHELCFFLHDQMVELLLQYEAAGAHTAVVEALHNAAIENGKNIEDIDILGFLREIDDLEPYKHHIISHVVMGLVSDMLHFLHESLRCFEKHKISVAFSLLRKPLKEHLLFLAWVLADENDFIKRFESKNYKTLSGIQKEKQLSILKKAISKVVVSELFDEELIWNIIFSKKHANGFEPTWQRATHLITSYGDLLKTEDYSINFIFENSTDGYYHEFLYSKLPYLMLFLTQVTFECFNRIQPLNTQTIDYSIVTTIGCYESLFLDGRKQSVTRMLTKLLKDFMKCTHCKANLKILKKNAPLFYLQESLICNNCGFISEFPLFWLMSKVNFSLDRKELNE